MTRLSVFNLFTFPSVMRFPPGQTESGMHRVIVLLDSLHEAHEFRNAGSLYLRHPGTPMLVLALADHLEEGLQEGVDRLYFRREGEQLLKSGLFFLIELLALAREQPAQGMWRESLCTLLA